MDREASNSKHDRYNMQGARKRENRAGRSETEASPSGGRGAARKGETERGVTEVSVGCSWASATHVIVSYSTECKPNTASVLT
jgi:hypothetical protein